jgi:hypothetical protein
MANSLYRKMKALRSFEEEEEDTISKSLNDGISSVDLKSDMEREKVCRSGEKSCTGCAKPAVESDTVVKDGNSKLSVSLPLISITDGDVESADTDECLTPKATEFQSFSAVGSTTFAFRNEDEMLDRLIESSSFWQDE